MVRYGNKSQEKVEEAVHNYKRGTLKSGKSRKKVTSRKQAVAIGLSLASKVGDKIPQAPKAKRRMKIRPNRSKK